METKKTTKIQKTTVYIFLGLVLVVCGLWLKNEKQNSSTPPYKAPLKRGIKIQSPNHDTLWQDLEEWKTLKEILKTESPSIIKQANIAGIKPRLLVSELVVEQLRLFNSNREIYKDIFAPLKTLGNQSQYSLGVMGIKLETAKEIENNLIDKNSAFYLGKNFENILKYKVGENANDARFLRLTDESDRSYSYLYAALANKQIISEWQNSGFDIKDNVGVLATLYNIGFKHSIPNANPKIGGAVINLNDEEYSFGELAKLFYESNELIETFPK